MTGMEWLLWMIAVAVLGLGAVAASGRLGEMPPTVTNTPVPRLPAGVIGADDLAEVRFAVVTRGYSIQQVDELLDRLSRQLREPTADSAPTPPTPFGESAPSAFEGRSEAEEEPQIANSSAAEGDS